MEHSHKVDSEELLAVWPGIEEEITAHCTECNPDYVPLKDRGRKPNLDVPPLNRLSIEAAERVNSLYAKPAPSINTDLTAKEYQGQMQEWLQLQAAAQRQAQDLEMLRQNRAVQVNQYSSGLNSANVVIFGSGGMKSGSN